MRAENGLSKAERSFECIARILAQVAEHGVVPSTVHVSNFFPSYSKDDVILVDSSVNWMIAENMIRTARPAVADTEDWTLHYSLVPTSFGLHVLQQEVTGSANGERVRDQIEEARVGAKSWSAVGELIGGAIGGLAKVMTNG